MKLPTLDSAGKTALDAFLNESVDKRNIPALFLGVTTADQSIYLAQAGERVFDRPEDGKVNENTVLQIFSATKLVTTIACLIAVDRHLLTLDSSDLVLKYLPELSDLHILQGYSDDGGEMLLPARNRITLRMLLSHSAGFAYAFNSPLIARWREGTKAGSMVAAGATVNTIEQPLLFEPGTDWQYSTGLDWAGVLLTRVTGQSLEEYFRKNIFEKCGMASTSFFPTEDLKKRMMSVCVRDQAGVLRVEQGSTMGREMEASKVGPFLSGGGGLFGTAKDYLSFLRAILASSPEHQGQKTLPLISSDSFRTLFTHALAEDSTRSLASLAVMAKEQNIHDPAILANGVGKHISHSVGLFINNIDSKFGRKAGSGCWDGAAKTYFFIDPVSGIAATCFTQIMAPNPDPFNRVYNEYERKLYDVLR